VEGGFRLWRRVDMIKPYTICSITRKFLTGKKGRGKTALFLWLRFDKVKNKFTFSNQSQFLTGQALYGIRILLQTANFLIEMLVFLI
jgi:hypothetical protein